MTDLLVIGAAAISAILGANTEAAANGYAVSDMGSEYFVRIEDVPLGLVYSDGVVTKSAIYYTSNAVCDMKLKIIKSNNVTPAKEVRKAIAEKFCKYVFSLC